MKSWKESTGQSGDEAQDLLHQLPGQVAVVSLSGNIVAANATWGRLERAQNFGGSTGLDYLPVCARASPESDGHASAALEGVMGVLAGRRAEFSMDFRSAKSQQHNSIWFRMRVTPIQWKGADAALVMHVDITREVSAREEALSLTAHLERRFQRRTRQLEAVNRELQAFSSSVSHDLKAPLSAIESLTYVLAKSLDGRLQPREQFYLERVRSGCTEMMGLIDAMLGLHRITHDLPLTLACADLSQIAEQIVGELRREDPARPALVRIDPGMSVQCDPVLMTVALRNLIGNAWKFSAKKGLTRIDVCVDERTESHVLLRVSDLGAGFDPRYADRLFAPFARLHHSLEFPGTGIGLATVQRIVRRHGGSIRAESTLGEGATFWIMLPQELSLLDTRP